MRIISFSKKWVKLKQPDFTTFRFPRKDRDWEVGEVVQVYYKNRTPQREKLGEAKILKLEKRYFYLPDEDVPLRSLMSHAEAKRDGFKNYQDMTAWLEKSYGGRIYDEPMNKLTLRWEATHE